MPEKSFPDKAIDLIDEASSKVSLQKVEGAVKEELPEVKPEHVQAVLAEMKQEKI